jgi:hypothetical protein
MSTSSVETFIDGKYNSLVCARDENPNELNMYENVNENENENEPGSKNMKDNNSEINTNTDGAKGDNKVKANIICDNNDVDDGAEATRECIRECEDGDANANYNMNEDANKDANEDDGKEGNDGNDDDNDVEKMDDGNDDKMDANEDYGNDDATYVELDAALPQLDQCGDHKLRDEILGVLSSWLGQMNNDLQHSFEQRFHEAMTEILDRVGNGSEAQAQDVPEIVTSLTYQGDAIDEIVNENKVLQNRCRVLEGRLERAEKEIKELKEESLMAQARSMRDNLKFFNIEEVREVENCEETIRDFLRSEMKIAPDDLKRIVFDRVHRVGNKLRNQNRVMVAKLNHEGKNIIFKHVKNLDRAKNYGISEQLPRELEERKKRLLPIYKEAKKENKNVKWSIDKLVVDGRVTAIEKDKVRDVHQNTTEKSIELQQSLRHSPTKSHQGHSFQGHSVSISEQDLIVPAIHAIYADARVARASHNIYAYRIKSGNSYLEHYEDDGEWGAGSKLLQLLRDNAIENKLVCTTCWDGSTHMLGRARSDRILNAAKETLQID